MKKAASKYAIDIHWSRSLAKSITFITMLTVLDFVLVYLLTVKLVIALGFVIISNIYTAMAYYFHERVWNKVAWGRKGTVQFESA